MTETEGRLICTLDKHTGLVTVHSDGLTKVEAMYTANEVVAIVKRDPWQFKKEDEVPQPSLPQPDSKQREAERAESVENVKRMAEATFRPVKTKKRGDTSKVL